MSKKNRETVPTLDDPTTLQAEAPVATLDHGDSDGGTEDPEGDDGDDDEEGEDFYYVVTSKAGLRSFHYDDREPAQVCFDFKLSRMFPFTPTSAFSDEEAIEFELGRERRL